MIDLPSLVLLTVAWVAVFALLLVERRQSNKYRRQRNHAARIAGSIARNILGDPEYAADMVKEAASAAGQDVPKMIAEAKVAVEMERLMKRNFPDRFGTLAKKDRYIDFQD